MVVKISKRAQSMLEKNTIFLSKVNPKFARYLNSVYKSYLKNLESNPLKYPIVYKNKKHEYRKILIDKKYVIIYHIQSCTIYVDIFANCKQDYGKYIF